MAPELCVDVVRFTPRRSHLPSQARQGFNETAPVLRTTRIFDYIFCRLQCVQSTVNLVIPMLAFPFSFSSNHANITT